MKGKEERYPYYDEKAADTESMWNVEDPSSLR
jgi:hypothetical protein